MSAWAWGEAFDELGVRIASRAELFAVGASGRGQAAAGVFAFDTTFTHAHLLRDASRCRHPCDRFAPLNSRDRVGTELHWTPLIEPEARSEWTVGAVDALVQAAQCQHPWHAIASLDSALFTGLISLDYVDRVFGELPARLQYLRARIDGRSEAGQESVLRMIVLDGGLECQVQVTFPGIGRVDLLLEGRLVVEADSRKYHDGWELHVRDRDRDIDLARRGYMSLRPVYQRTMFRPTDVRDAILQLLAADSRFRVHL